MPKLNEWTYLGDAVYAKPDQFGIWLHTSDHLEPTDKIYLEWEVITALNLVVKQIMLKGGPLNATREG